METYYVIALGNPGAKYESTRHNVGWMAADAWRAKHSIGDPDAQKHIRGRLARGQVSGAQVELLYPETYMNRSGEAAASLVPPEAVAQLIVLHDDLDLPFGEVKISVGRGDGGHNGVRSLVTHLKSKQFVRIRIGIASRGFFGGAPRRPEGGAALERFVLKPFSLLERSQLASLTSKAADALDTIIEHGPERAMNEVN